MTRAGTLSHADDKAIRRRGTRAAACGPVPGAQVHALALPTVAAVGGAVVIGYLVAGCGPSAAAALYGAKLEACLQTSTTCQAYIACRDGVQVAEGRGHYQASCEPSDAGADALVVDARADALEAGVAEGGAK